MKNPILGCGGLGGKMDDKFADLAPCLFHSVRITSTSRKVLNFGGVHEQKK